MKRIGLLLLTAGCHRGGRAGRPTTKRRSRRSTPSAKRFCSPTTAGSPSPACTSSIPGENKFGSDPLNDIVLEFADVPKQAGVITMDGKNVTIKAADGQTLTYNGKPVKEGPLRLAENRRPADLITYKSHVVLPALQRSAARDSRARSERAAAQEFLGPEVVSGESGDAR